MRGYFRNALLTHSIVVSVVMQVASVLAQPAADPRPVAKTKTVGEVLLEPSRVYIYVGKSGFGHEHAVAGKLREGHVNLGATQNAGHLIFEMSSFVADPDYARKFIGLEGISDVDTQRKVTANMLGPEVLDVTRFPIAEFRIISAVALANRSQRGLPVYELSGDFTLHGVTKSLRLRSEVQLDHNSSRMMGSFAVRQSDFGIEPISKGFGMIAVADELKIYGDIHLANDAVNVPQK